MQLLDKILRWWQNLSKCGKTSSIKCPYCGGIVQVSLKGRWGQLHSFDKVHVVAPGTVVPCEKCGKNLADFLRSGKAAV